MRVILRTILQTALLFCAAMAVAQAPDTVEQPTTTPAVAAARQADNLAVIPIEGEINRYTALSVERRLSLAEDSGADAVVFELDTPGGEVGAVLEICNLIKSTPLPTTAWVNQDAYSGGAIIALACEEIVVAPYATMGDAAPVAMNPVTFAQGLQRTERQKILQPLITEVVDSARRHGYDERLVQAFLTLGIELWLIEHTESGRRVFVTEDQYTSLFNESPPRDAVRAASGSTPGTEAAAGDPLDPEIRSAVERSQELPPTVPDLTGESAADWAPVEYAVDGESLLTLKTEDLQRFGLAEGVVSDDAALTARFGAANLSRVGLTWSERMVLAMTSLWIRGLLVAIFLIAAFVEFIAPGVGLPGMVAIGALALLIGPPALVGAAAWWALAAIVAGIGLVLVEVLVIPGFGVFGIAGLIALFMGLVGAVVGPGPLFPDSPSRSQDLLHALATVLVSTASAGVAIFFISRYHGAIPIFNRLVLSAQSGDEIDSEELITPNAKRGETPRVSVGDRGLTTTPLRPSGTAEFDGRLVDVVAGLGMIDANSPVRVTELDGVRVIVNAVNPEDTTHPESALKPENGEDA